MSKFLTANLDFETYSAAGYAWDAENKKRIGGGLSDIGVAKYSEHPGTEVLCAAYKLPHSPNIEVWLPDRNDPPYALFSHLENGGLLAAFNMSFEFWIWQNVCVKKYGWPSLSSYQSQLRCTQAAARAFALPPTLEKAAEVLGTSAQKDKRGRQLISLFSMPHAPLNSDCNLRRVTFTDAPDDAQEMINYCVQDVRTEMAIAEAVPALTGFELDYWKCDQARNRRGVSIDAEAVQDCIKVVEETLIECSRELAQIIDGDLITYSAVPKITKWLSARTQGLIDGMTSEKITEYLKSPLPPDVRRVLEIRQASASTSINKLYAMERMLCGGDRVYELFLYHKARTGRAGGSGIQPQNLPSSGAPVAVCINEHFSPADNKHCVVCFEDCHPTEWGILPIEETLRQIKLGGASLLKLTRGDVLAAIAGCLRGLFVAAPGHRLICSDYNSIEAVVIAELAEEEWRLEVFRTHGQIYESSAAKITGTPLELILQHKRDTGLHHPLRRLGKTAELASAYQGWVGAWKQFGADDYFTNEQELKNAILAWRNASPRIVALWSQAQTAAMTALKSGETCYAGNYFYYFYDRERDILLCTLPSGRQLTYHRPRIIQGARGEQIVFNGWNSDSSKGRVGWITLETYGGKLVENVVQAVARDILAYAVLNLEKAGYPVVLDVHDEIVCEVKNGAGSLEEMEGIMRTMPAWAQGWAISASGGWEGHRYRK